MCKPAERTPIWTYAAASRTLPYLRLVLRDLRQNFILIWHCYRIGGNRVDHPDYRDQIRLLADEGRTILKELDRLGVIAYQSPLRGIALFPFLVHEGKGRRREAFYVFKDTRSEIDTYILADALCTHHDLYGYERPVPEAWTRPEVIPTLNEETTR